MALNLFTYKKTNSIVSMVYCMSIVPNKIVQPCTRMSFSPLLYHYYTVFFNYIFSIPIAFSNENVPCVAFEIYDSLFSTSFWMAFTKKTFYQIDFAACIHKWKYHKIRLYTLILVFFCIYFFFNFKIVSLFKHRLTR